MMVRKAVAAIALIFFTTIVNVAATEMEPIVPSDGVSNVVFALIRGNDLTAVKKRSECFQEALDKAGQIERFDTIVFYEGAQSPPTDQLPPGFRLVSASDYGFGRVPDMDNSLEMEELSDDALGYRHMCRFMSMLWFKALSRYDYAMRMDDDVCVQELPADPFHYMAHNDLVYAYGVAVPEYHLETVMTMGKWLLEYQFDKGVSNQLVIPNNIFFTNFFVSKVSWWERQDVQAYLDGIDKSGGIYNHRWGDAPIQTTALKLMAEEWQITHFPLSYTHGSTRDIIYRGSIVKHPGDSTDDVVVEMTHRLLQEINSTQFFGSSINSTEFSGSSFNSTEFSGSSFNASEFFGSSTNATDFFGSSINATEFFGSSGNATRRLGSSHSRNGVRMSLWEILLKGRADDGQ